MFALQNVTIKLYADGPCSTFGDKVFLDWNINQTCPAGFVISHNESACMCAWQIWHAKVYKSVKYNKWIADDIFWVEYLLD